MILLARHGETADNREPVRVQGRRDVPLTARGRAQARELAARVAEGPPPRALYTSDLARARETAEIVGAAIGLEPRVDARFAESDRGRWEGLRWDEIAAQDPAGFAAWKAAGADFRFPAGESLREQQVRVVAALAELEQLPALVVCHGGTIRVALCLRDPRGLDAFHDFEVPNGALIAHALEPA